MHVVTHSFCFNVAKCNLGKVNREVKHDIYGKRQTVVSCVSQKNENLCFSTCLTLLRSYSIYLGNTQERGLNKSNFSVFWQKENFISPFAENVMLNLESTCPAVFPKNLHAGWRQGFALPCADESALFAICFCFAIIVDFLHCFASKFANLPFPPLLEVRPR